MSFADRYQDCGSRLFHRVTTSSAIREAVPRPARPGLTSWTWDPLLGPLASNGGPTQTHALLPASPAVDAGDPAAPGSGGTACAASDQQGTLRPLGAKCDIGAYERLVSFSITGITPNHAGNSGLAVVTIAGGAIQPGATARLSRSGHADIDGYPPVWRRAMRLYPPPPTSGARLQELGMWWSRIPITRPRPCPRRSP